MATNRRGALATVVATWFGCGYVAPAPGTVGSLSAVGLAVLLDRSLGWEPLWFGVLALAWLVPAVWASGVFASRCGEKDPGAVVVDEVVGQWITLAGAVAVTPKMWLAAFLLFRGFDIWKPFPIRLLERLGGGVGIVADDVMAGVYAATTLFVIGLMGLY